MTQPTVELERPMLLSAAEVARQLSISQRQVWRLVSSGELPAPVRVGERSSRFRRADIEAYVDSLGLQ